MGWVRFGLGSVRSEGVAERGGAGESSHERWKLGAEMSTADAGDLPPGTRVIFLDQTGSKSVEALIADSVTVQRILPQVITKLRLPALGPEGQPMSYSLDHEEGGQRLREEQTLPEANVHDGDHLIVYPEMVAGTAAWSAS